MKKPRILFLVPANYCALKEKNVAHLIFERDEYGFFEKVITVHPIAFKKQFLKLNTIHELYEYNLGKYIFYSRFLLPFLPLKLFFILKEILQVIKNEKIDIIRATDPYLMGLIAWMLSRLTNIPFCISLHCDYEKRFLLNPKKGYRSFLRYCAKKLAYFVLPKANLVMPIRECYVGQLIKQGVLQEYIRVIPHGINFNFQPYTDLKEIYGIPREKKIISFVGRLAKDNYIEDMLKMVECLSKIRNDFILVIVGDGEMAEDINRWICRKPNLKDSVCLLGFQSNYTCRSLRYISHINLCLMAGFSLIEAAAAATPLVAYDIEWHSELVQNDITGFLVNEHDIQGLVGAIIYLLDNPTHARHMGNNAKIRAEKFHSLKETSKIKCSFYSELLSNTNVTVLPTPEI